MDDKEYHRRMNEFHDEYYLKQVPDIERQKEIRQLKEEKRKFDELQRQIKEEKQEKYVLRNVPLGLFFYGHSDEGYPSCDKLIYSLKFNHEDEAINFLKRNLDQKDWVVMTTSEAQEWISKRGSPLFRKSPSWEETLKSDADLQLEQMTCEVEANEAIKDMHENDEHKSDGRNDHAGIEVKPYHIINTWPIEQQVGFYRSQVLKFIMRMGSKGDWVSSAKSAAFYANELVRIVSDKRGE